MNTAIEAVVEQNIPLPLPNRRSALWLELNVGDSFFVPKRLTEPKYKAQRRISWYAVRYGRKLGRKFKTRLMDGGVRVWRMA